MVTETLETQAAPPAEEANPSPDEQTQTEAPSPDESAVATQQEDVASKPDQIEVAPPEAPKYMTEEQAERFWAEREEKARADEREREQNRRRTEAANDANRKAKLEKRRGRLKEGVTASLITHTGVAPEASLDPVIDGAIDIAAELLREEGEQTIALAWEHMVAPITKREVELTVEAAEITKFLSPKIQWLVDTIRPAFFEEARKGYVPESDLPKIREDAIAAHNAKGREGVDELKRADGTPASTDNSTVADRLDRIGTSRETDADRQWWDEREAAKAKRRG